MRRQRSPGSLRGFCVWAGEEGARLYLRPLAPAPGEGVPLAGTGLAFARAEIVVRQGDAVERAGADVEAIRAWADASGRAAELDALLARISAPRPSLAGLALDRPRLLGVVNVTPDSFSDGGDFLDAGAAIDHGLALREAGADILDIGGESTRPGAWPVGEEEELRRVRPVVRALAARGVPVSIDTRSAAVARAAIDEGAAIVNDVSALRDDPALGAVVAAAGVPVVLMHMLGDPATMQQAPVYRDVTLDIADFLADRIAACEAMGIGCDRIVVDPGIGFGKTVGHNLALVREAALFAGLGCAVLYGLSRKAFIGRLSRGEPPKQRVAGSIAAGLLALGQGVHLLRVHDVAETAQAVAVWRAGQGLAAASSHEPVVPARPAR